jgi:D-glycero-alpha-D-manno-heptose-7-phosphate kinase
MLIARAPLRISLAGGGTDLPAYYEKHGGLVVSTTIDKYVYVLVSGNPSETVQITSADYRMFYRHHFGTPMSWDGDLGLPRAVLHEFGIERGVSVFVASEVPPGTGLGSSGAVAAALIRAIAAYLDRSLTPAEVADLACRIELEKLGAPVGKQDQFAAAFGGLNAFCFERDRTVVEAIEPAAGALAELQRHLLLFFTGTARNSATILQEQQRATRQGQSGTLEALHQIKGAAQSCRAALEAGDVAGIGELLREGWAYKKRVVSGITTGWIDETYEMARACGAVGGKITGAGGGGFLLLFCPPACQDRLTDAMESRGLRRMEFRFSRQGAAVASVQWGWDHGAPTFDRFAELLPIAGVAG